MVLPLVQLRGLIRGTVERNAEAVWQRVVPECRSRSVIYLQIANCCHTFNQDRGHCYVRRMRGQPGLVDLLVHIHMDNQEAMFMASNLNTFESPGIMVFV